jgi:hypothetical protein
MCRDIIFLRLLIRKDWDRMAGAGASARYLSFLSWFHYQVFLSDTTIISRHAKLNSFQLTHLLEHVVLKLVSLKLVSIVLVITEKSGHIHLKQCPRI